MKLFIKFFNYNDNESEASSLHDAKDGPDMSSQDNKGLSRLAERIIST